MGQDPNYDDTESFDPIADPLMDDGEPPPSEGEAQEELAEELDEHRATRDASE